MKTYLEKQREFWNVDPNTSKFGRVDTVSSDKVEYEKLADEHFATITSGIDFTSNMTILEIGCGVGRLLSRMQRLEYRKLIGVDISANMIELAHQNTAVDDRLQLAVNTGADLSMVPSDTVDFCYSNDVFIHIADLDVVSSYVREVARILAPDGLFRFNVRELNLQTMFSNSFGGLLGKATYLLRVRSGLHRWKPGTEGFNGLKFTPRDLTSIAAAAGLQVRSISASPDPSGGSFLWCDLARRG